jgi:hypothetical protein
VICKQLIQQFYESATIVSSLGGELFADRRIPRAQSTVVLRPRALPYKSAICQWRRVTRYIAWQSRSVAVRGTGRRYWLVLAHHEPSIRQWPIATALQHCSATTMRVVERTVAPDCRGTAGRSACHTASTTTTTTTTCKPTTSTALEVAERTSVRSKPLAQEMHRDRCERSNRRSAPSHTSTPIDDRAWRHCSTKVQLHHYSLQRQRHVRFDCYGSQARKQYQRSTPA